MRPAGALTKAEAKKLQSAIIVFSDTNPSVRNKEIEKVDITRLIRQGWSWPDGWFDGRYGYFFDNYFHALAYSLKIKAKIKVKA